MITRAVFCAFILLLGCPWRAVAAPCALADLAWMAGNWQSKSDPARTQERWAPGPDGVLMGNAWELPLGKPGFAEIMKVHVQSGAVVLVLRHFDGALARAWEEREAPLIFSAASCEPGRARFEGQGAHAGEHIEYRRSGAEFTFLGDFLHQGKPFHAELHMVPVAP